MSTIAAFYSYSRVLLQSDDFLARYEQVWIHTCWFILQMAGIVMLVYNASLLTDEVNIYFHG